MPGSTSCPSAAKENAGQKRNVSLVEVYLSSKYLMKDLNWKAMPCRYTLIRLVQASLIFLLSFSGLHLTMAQTQDYWPAIDVVGGSWSAGPYPNSFTQGWEFQIEKEVTVEALGVYEKKQKKPSGLSADVHVSLWKADGSLVTRTFVPKGTKGELIGDFRYAPIEPVTLNVGEKYVVGALYTPAHKELISGSPFYLDSRIKWIQSRNIFDQKEIMFPTKASQSLRIGASLRFTKETKQRTYVSLLQVAYNEFKIMMLPERPDKSHLSAWVVLVSVYANRDGELKQIAVDGKAKGAGEQGFRNMGRAYQKKVRDFVALTGLRPTLRIASAPWTPVEVIQEVIARTDDSQVIREIQAARRVGRGAESTRPGWIQLVSHIEAGPNNIKNSPKERFIDHETHVEDSWTGLIWQADGTAAGKLDFYEAQQAAKEFEIGELKNWRVPTGAELATIFPAKHSPFRNSDYNPKPYKKDDGEVYPTYWTSEVNTSRDGVAFVYVWYSKGARSDTLASKNKLRVRYVHDPLPKKREGK